MSKFELGQSVYAIIKYFFNDKASLRIEYGKITRIGLKGDEIYYNIGDNTLSDFKESDLILTEEEAREHIEELFKHIKKENENV